MIWFRCWIRRPLHNLSYKFPLMLWRFEFCDFEIQPRRKRTIEKKKEREKKKRTHTMQLTKFFVSFGSYCFNSSLINSDDIERIEERMKKVKHLLFQTAAVCLLQCVNVNTIHVVAHHRSTHIFIFVCSTFSIQSAFSLFLSLSHSPIDIDADFMLLSFCLHLSPN